MTESELMKIENRLSKSTAGKWVPMIEGITHDSGSDFIMTNAMNCNDSANPNRGQDIELLGGTSDDVIFIAHAKQDIQMLIREIRKLRSMT